jgi:PAS domain S-box-containing protein
LAASGSRSETVPYHPTSDEQAEKAISQAELDWDRTFDSVPDLIAILDEKHHIVKVNRAMAQHLGIPPEQCLGLTCYECIHKANQPIALCPHVQTLKDGKEHTTEVHDENLGVDFIVSTTPLRNENGQIIGSVHVARDITEYKRSETLLRSALERYRSFIEVTGELGWTTNADGEVVEDIPSFRRFTGQTYDEVKGWGWASALHRDDVERTKRVWKEATVKRSRYEIEYRLRRHDGVYRHFLARGVPVFGEDGTVREWVGTCIDITERKDLEKELVESLEASQRRQTEVSALLTASRAVLQHKEFKDSARAIFNACKDLLGARAGYVALLSNDGKENEVLFLDAGGLPCTVDPSLPMPIRGLRAEAYCSGRAVYQNDFLQSQWAALMPEGHALLESVLFAPLTIDKKTVGVIGLANKLGGFGDHDMAIATAFGELASVALVNSRMLEMLEESERQLKEHSEHLEELVEERSKKLQDAERLAAIGQTAGMVGHDIRSPLQTMVGELYLMNRELHDMPESEARSNLEESVKLMEKQAQYMNKIVLDLQDVARTLKPCMEEIDLKKTLHDILSVADLPETIETTCSIKEEFPRLKTDQAFLKRILTNLISNAVQAMPNGGKLAIAAVYTNENVRISVQDTGQGIPEQASDQLFKPLFTTKAKGQGFGLAIIKRFTEALNGKVTFESEIGKGTKFTIEIPLPRKS